MHSASLCVCVLDRCSLLLVACIHLGHVSVFWAFFNGARSHDRTFSNVYVVCSCVVTWPTHIRTRTVHFGTYVCCLGMHVCICLCVSVNQVTTNIVSRSAEASKLYALFSSLWEQNTKATEINFKLHLELLFNYSMKKQNCSI